MKKNSVSLPSASGGLLGGYDTTLQTKIMFSPKVIIALCLLVVLGEIILHNL